MTLERVKRVKTIRQYHGIDEGNRVKERETQQKKTVINNREHNYFYEEKLISLLSSIIWVLNYFSDHSIAVESVCVCVFGTVRSTPMI